MKSAAIILAGGKAKRFQNTAEPWQDKSLALLEGKPLLVHALEAVCKVVDEVVVCVNDESRKKTYEAVMRNFTLCEASVRVDERFDGFGGPLVAIYTGLKAVDAEVCLTLPGDMPLLKPEVAGHMLREAEAAAIVVPMWPNGRLETLTMTLQRRWAHETALTLCLLGRPRSDDLFRAAPFAKFLSAAQLSNIDPQLKSFVNINEPPDLKKLEPRRSEGPVKEDICIFRDTASEKELQQIQISAKLLREDNFKEASEKFFSTAQILTAKDAVFWAAVNQEKAGASLLSATNLKEENQTVPEAKVALMKAAELYGREADFLEKRKCHFLAMRARSDQIWCESQANALSPMAGSR